MWHGHYERRQSVYVGRAVQRCNRQQHRSFLWFWLLVKLPQILSTSNDLQYVGGGWGWGGNMFILCASRATACGNTYSVVSSNLVTVSSQCGHIRIHGRQHLPFPAATSCFFSWLQFSQQFVPFENRLRGSLSNVNRICIPSHFLTFPLLLQSESWVPASGSMKDSVLMENSTYWN